MGGLTGGGGGGNTTTVQKSDPWSGQQPYLKDVFSQAQNQFNSNTPQYFPNSTVVPFSPETQTALNLTTLRALNGSPVENAAQNQLSSTLNGDYLYGGQGFNQALQAAHDQILPMVQSDFNSAGRINSGLAQTSEAQQLGNSFANLYSQGRQNQMQSMLFAPQMANQDYADIGQLANVGQQHEALQGQQLQDQMDRWNFQQNLPAQKLSQYDQLINGTYGGTTTSTSPYYQNRGAGLLGGALGGASLASMLGASVTPTAAASAAAASALGSSAWAGPWGLAAGAGLGMLFGGG